MYFESWNNLGNQCLFNVNLKLLLTLLLTEVMLGVYTEETFNSLTKPHIIDLFLKTQKHTNSTICKSTDEIGNLNVNFKRLESDI